MTGTLWRGLWLHKKHKMPQKMLMANRQLTVCQAACSALHVDCLCQSSEQACGRCVMVLIDVHGHAHGVVPGSTPALLMSPGFSLGAIFLSVSGLVEMVNQLSPSHCGPRGFFKSHCEGKGKSSWNFPLPELGILSLSLETRRIPRTG